MEIRSTVPSNMKGMHLIEYLEKRFTYLTRDQWLERVAENRFVVDGNSATEDTVLNGGSLVVYDMPPLVEPPADLSYTIVYEDDRFMAVNKSGNLLVHKSGRSITSNLIYQLRECHKPPYPTAHIVNRLDRETSGLVLVAKDTTVLKQLNWLFQERLIEKTYLAIVDGAPVETEGDIRFSICKNEETAIGSKHRVGHPDEGKSAFTHYTVVTRGTHHSLLEMKPKTGRVHQLRLHAKSLGCPIIGDKLYNLSEETYLKWQKDRESVEPFDVPRQMLHCCNLQFTLWGKSYNIDAPVPDDFRRQLSLKIDC